MTLTPFPIVRTTIGNSQWQVSTGTYPGYIFQTTSAGLADMVRIPLSNPNNWSILDFVDGSAQGDGTYYSYDKITPKDICEQPHIHIPNMQTKCNMR